MVTWSTGVLHGSTSGFVGADAAESTGPFLRQTFVRHYSVYLFACMPPGKIVPGAAWAWFAAAALGRYFLVWQGSVV